MKFSAPLREVHAWSSHAFDAWDGFWFTPRSSYVYSLLRIATGLFLLYSHFVLAADLSSFLGREAWINPELARSLHDGKFGESDWGRSYLWYIESNALLWLHHAFTLAVTAMFTVGLGTRITAPAAWLLQLMYIHRLTGALFGLDQIITYMVMYLSLTPCGSFLSVDAIIRKRLGAKLDSNRKLQWLFPDQSPSVATNVATRLLQIHLCVIYLFGGLAKARGESWWDGTAIWYAVGNHEYQSLDMTWLASYPRVFSLLTHITLFWEVSYCFIVWPKLLRPLTLAIAVAVHGGIALTLGMSTFGLAMICANMIFVDPEWLRRWFTGEKPLTLQGESVDHEIEMSALADDDLMDSSLGDSGLGGSGLNDSGLGDSGFNIGSASGSVDFPPDIKERIIERAKKVRAAGDKVRKRYLLLKEREKALKLATKELERRKRRFERKTGKEGNKPSDS
jgi:Vitamin K-dependent gamma-carboxylase